MPVELLFAAGEIRTLGLPRARLRPLRRLADPEGLQGRSHRTDRDARHDGRTRQAKCVHVVAVTS